MHLKLYPPALGGKYPTENASCSILTIVKQPFIELIPSKTHFVGCRQNVTRNEQNVCTFALKLTFQCEGLLANFYQNGWNIIFHQSKYYLVYYSILFKIILKWFTHHYVMLYTIYTHTYMYMCVLNQVWSASDHDSECKVKKRENRFSIIYSCLHMKILSFKCLPAPSPKQSFTIGGMFPKLLVSRNQHFPSENKF